LRLLHGEPGSEIEAMYAGDSDPECIERVSGSFKAEMKNLFVVPTKIGLSDMSTYVNFV
jgi:hypothetical protein